MAVATRQRVTRQARLTWVSLGDMHVADAAQRDFRQYRVDRLLENFDPEQMGYPTVNIRPDQTVHVIDGQHRVRALQEWLGGDGQWEQQHIQCQTYEGLTEREEAEMFLLLNDTLTVSSFDKFMIGVTAGRSMESEIRELVEDKHHIAISKTLRFDPNKYVGSINAVGTLVRIWQRSDLEVLGRSLRIAWEAYGQAGMESAVLDGIALMVDRHSGIDDMDMAAKLRHKLGTTQLLTSAREIRERMRASLGTCIAAAAIQIYNKKTTARSRKLPTWWSIADVDE